MERHTLSERNKPSTIGDIVRRVCRFFAALFAAKVLHTESLHAAGFPGCPTGEMPVIRMAKMAMLRFGVRPVAFPKARDSVAHPSAAWGCGLGVTLGDAK